MRISSHDGCYQSTLHLTEYFRYTKDTANTRHVFERFIQLYPTDQRGYSNYTLYLQQFGKSMDEKIVNIFEDWLKHDPQSNEARVRYANFHLDVGNRFYLEGNFESAKGHLIKSILLNPYLADAYNSLGIVYRKLGANDSAIFMYQRSVELDPQSIYAYINLGNTYDDAGNSVEAIEWYRKAIALQPNNATAYLNLGIAYYKQRAYSEALEALQHAARLGDRQAQTFLSQRGERW